MKKKLVKKSPAKKDKTELQVAEEIVQRAFKQINKRFGERISIVFALTDGNSLEMNIGTQKAQHLSWIATALNAAVQKYISPRGSIFDNVNFDAVAAQMAKTVKASKK